MVWESLFSNKNWSELVLTELLAVTDLKKNNKKKKTSSSNFSFSFNSKGSKKLVVNLIFIF